MGGLFKVLGIFTLLIGVNAVILGIVGIPPQIIMLAQLAIHSGGSGICQPGEQLTPGNLSSADPTQALNNLKLYCVDAAGQRRDVTAELTPNGASGERVKTIGKLSLTLIGGCLLALGLALFLIGSVISRWQTRRTILTIVMPEVQKLLAQMNVDNTLAGKLRQIDDARLSTLISEDEYQRLRAGILEQMK